MTAGGGRGSRRVRRDEGGAAVDDCTWANALRAAASGSTRSAQGDLHPAYVSAGMGREQAVPAVPLIPAGRVGLESEAGAAIAFLASGDASFVNGAKAGKRLPRIPGT